MEFNKERYLAEYMRPRSKVRELSDDDLIERYALTLPAADPEIAAQIRAVRSYWHSMQPGTREGKLAKLCRTADEALKKQHGDDMLTEKWWAKCQAEASKAVQARVEEMAALLHDAYGQFGAVTSEVVDDYATKLGLRPTDGLRAAEQAGLRVVDGVELPETSPIPSVNFAKLSEQLVGSGARTVPNLVHPDTGPFRLLKRFTSLKDPSLRLDGVAVLEQINQASKLGTSAADTDRRGALQQLKSALDKGVDLDRLALYHLISLVAERSSLGPAAVRGELEKYGLDKQDAAVVALLVVAQGSGGPLGFNRVQTLLAEGRLNEADEAARQLPDALPRKAEAIALVEKTRADLKDLLAQAEQARVAQDEVRAMALVRKAAAISADDAEQAMTAIPLTPPGDLRLVPEGNMVRAVWQPGAEHPEGTTYVVSRSLRRAPLTPGDGQELSRKTDTRFDDPLPQVAQPVYYSMFAMSAGRPVSRPASASITLLPPVGNLTSDVGPDSVTLSWSAHPAAERVEVVRADPGTPPVPIPVTGNSCQLTGLPPGRALHFQVTAVYRGLDGREMRSPTLPVNATPRSKARPVMQLRARPVQEDAELRVRVTWPVVDNSEVRIVRSSSQAPWSPGTWLSPDDVARFGTEVTGPRKIARGEVTLEAELPVGVHHLVALSTGGTGTVTGASTSVGVTAPVKGLRVTEFSDHAVLAWEWPSTAKMAEVTWQCEDDGEADVIVVGEAEYRAAGGVRVPLRGSAIGVEVRALIHVNRQRFAAPPVSTTISAAAETVVRYEVHGAGVMRLGGRSKRITFVSDEACSGVKVRVVASPGAVQPLSADRGVPLLDTRLDLAAGVPVSHAVSVPKGVTRPFWVRAFVVGGFARLVDPPPNQLKEG
jgi:hypothetical protein